jgi:SagB-type dehydrogenase family enzyme
MFSRIFRGAALGATVVLLLVVATPPGHSQTLSLPEPSRDGQVSVEDAIHSRRSIRDFDDRPLTLAEVGQLLWAAGGVTVDGVSGPTRAAPSAGGLYPLTAYVVAGNVEELPPGVYRYLWQDHGLRRLRAGDLREALRRAALGQRAIAGAPATIVLGADYAVTRRRYGPRGVERYVHMDAGHAAQNVALQAEALGLGLVTIGAFNDDQVKSRLDLDTEPLYLMPVGQR